MREEKNSISCFSHIKENREKTLHKRRKKEGRKRTRRKKKGQKKESGGKMYWRQKRCRWGQI